MTRSQRSINRRDKIIVNKCDLHSVEHHRYHFELNDTQSWNLLYKLSLKDWELQNNQKAPTKVDKNIVKIINLEDKYNVFNR
uniref:hypothetical protein n=1 Tax=Aliarcobacter sp. TaxID=2321116 RepID=UPI00404706EB